MRSCSSRQAGFVPTATTPVTEPHDRAWKRCRQPIELAGHHIRNVVSARLSTSGLQTRHTVAAAQLCGQFCIPLHDVTCVQPGQWCTDLRVN